MDVDDVKEGLTRKKAPKAKVKSKDLLSSGVTTLNLLVSGRTAGAFPKGRIVNVVGDSESGKTWLAMTTLAEAANNPNFEDYILHFIDVEGGAEMNLEGYFGVKLASLLVWHHPTTLEEMYDTIDDLIAEGKPFVVVVDSMDALTSDDEIGQVLKEKTARAKGKDTSGSYGTSKAKTNSARLRVVANKIRESGSIVFLLSQTRTNIGFTARFDPKTMAGGLALKFYSRVQLWLSVKKQIKKAKVRGKDRRIGAKIAVRVKKNQVTGRHGTVVFTFYSSHGIDDVGSMIDYLIEEKHWKVISGKVDAVEFGLAADRESLIAYIESNNLESELRAIVGRVWREIEEACAVTRKKRYE